MAVQVSLWPHLRFKRGRTHLQTHVIVGRIQISVSGDPSASVSFWVLARDCSQLLEATVSLCYMCVCMQNLESYPSLYDPMDCSPPGSSVHGILQAKILKYKWVLMPSSRGSS